jgi:hypothetical protein
MHLINDFQVARWKEKLFFAHLNAVDDPQFPMWEFMHGVNGTFPASEAPFEMAVFHENARIGLITYKLYYNSCQTPSKILHFIELHRKI